MYTLRKLKENRPKKVLLVTPTSYSEVGLTKWLSPNLGIERIAGYLKKHGHSVETFDTNLYHATKIGPSLKEKLKSHKWDVIGFSVYDDSIVNDIVNMNIALKECPEALIVAGGTGAQFDYQTILDKSPARIVVLGEGEKPLLKLLQGVPFEDIPGIVLKNYNTPLNENEFIEATKSIAYDRIPYEQYWDYYVDLYKKTGREITKELSQQIHTIRVYTRNYCPMGCKFCSSTNLIKEACGKNSVPLADISGNDLIRLLEKIIKAHPRVETIYFTDDDFTSVRTKLIEFLKLLIEKDLPLTFISFARIDNIDEEVVSLMKMANFRTLNIGVENFQEEMLNEFNKKLDLKSINNNLSILNKYGIRPALTFILCSPKAKLEYIENTAKRILDELKKKTIYAGVMTVVGPLKGSGFYEGCSDFEIQNIPIPNSKMFYKRVHFIKSYDPEVLEFQYRFLYRWAHFIKDLTKKGEDHFNSQVQSEMKLEVVLKVIDEIKSERENPQQLKFSRMSYEEKENLWNVLQKYSYGVSI